MGIIQSFDALGGRIGAARGEMLAHGISLALFATAFGLSIAIVAVTFYYYFLNRVDVLIRELDDRTRQVIELVSSESQRLVPQDRRHAADRGGRLAPSRVADDLSGASGVDILTSRQRSSSAPEAGSSGTFRCLQAAASPTMRRSST